MDLTNYLNETPATPVPLNAKEAAVVLALVKIARDHYDHFDPVTLDVPYEIVILHANKIEQVLLAIPQGGQAQFSFGAISLINSVLLDACGQYSRFERHIPPISIDEVSDLEERFADVPRPPRIAP